jgi:type II secretory pathway component PulC
LEINEIRDLIQTATSEAEQPDIYPEKLASRGISIPNLKVKGIIFFSSGSPSNHIFVSTLESKNRKVRVGETVQAATLKHIESNRVVFSYRGETVHLRIGE